MQNKICIFSNILKPHILLVTQAITQLMKISTVDFRTRISSIFDPRHRLLTLDLHFRPSTFDPRPRFSTSTFEPRPQLLNLDPRPVTHDPRQLPKLAPLHSISHNFSLNVPNFIDFF
jgi:hypothetical protein